MIGAEVRPELSLKEFQRSLGEVIVHLTSPYWRSRVEEAMIIMPHRNLSAEDSLKNKFNHLTKLGLSHDELAILNEHIRNGALWGAAVVQVVEAVVVQVAAVVPAVAAVEAAPADRFPVLLQERT